MKVLSKDGLGYLWSKIKANFAAANHTHSEYALEPTLAHNATLPSVTVPSGEWTVLGTVELSKGRYIGAVYTQFAANGTGYRVVGFGQSTTLGRNQKATQAGHTGTANVINVPRIFTISETKTYNIYAYQNSGSNLLCYPAYSFWCFPYSENEGGVSDDD